MKALIILFSVILSPLSVHCSDEDPSSEELITNSQPAEPNQFPYQALLLLQTYSFQKLCGGTLISEEWILTAAHCLRNVREINVTLGTIYPDGRDGTTVTTSTYLIYENNTPDLYFFDIGLIKLDSPVELSNSIKPASLPDSSEEEQSFEGSNAIASGWGKLSPNNNTHPDVLQYINVTVISNEECRISFPWPNSWCGIQDWILCIRTTPEYTTPWFGDSGGPLVVSDTNTLIGITSFVHTLGSDIGYPPIFTRVSSFLDWIASTSGIST